MKCAFLLCSAAFFILMAAFMLYDLTWKTYPYFPEITLAGSVRTIALLLFLGVFGVAALFSKD